MSLKLQLSRLSTLPVPALLSLKDPIPMNPLSPHLSAMCRYSVKLSRPINGIPSPSVNVQRDNLLYIGDGTIDDLLNSGVKQLKPFLVSTLNEAFGDAHVTSLVDALKELPSTHPITTDLAIIAEKWLSHVEPGKSMRSSKVGSKAQRGDTVLTSKAGCRRVEELRKQLTAASEHSLVTTFLDCNPAAAPHRELLYDPSRVASPCLEGAVDSCAAGAAP